ncbi:MAG: isoprenylcysteine carboxylmethyltransferase family protein [Chloroflexi bacterium]|nr:isoprenylcysteine carboxylmethyltransferase family protein [Chloroflexota bacterium]
MSNQPRIISPRVILQLLFFIVVIPFLPLLISWRWDWWEAWTYAILSILGFAISRVLAARRHPDLIAERARTMQHENAKPWDRRLAPLLGIGGGLVLLVAGLDTRFDWSPTFSWPVKILSLVVILAGYALGSYALIANRFSSGVVRIQAERGHHVISSGPYRWMRHPGYAGALLTYLATPLFLDSRWAFLPTLFIAVLLIVRTALEDRALQDELDGYRDYVGRVHYRLLPGVW